MTHPLRILLAGFEALPGAPYNPTPALVDRLTRLRRPAFADVERAPHIFPVSYAAVDRELPDLLARHRPDALLMFGLAARTPVRSRRDRARNAVTQLWPDAAHSHVGKRAIAATDDARNLRPAHRESRCGRHARPASTRGCRATREVTSAITCAGACWNAAIRLKSPPSSMCR